MPEPKKSESKDKYVIHETATETAQVFKNLDTGETLNLQQLLLEIANSLEALKRQLVG